MTLTENLKEMGGDFVVGSGNFMVDMEEMEDNKDEADDDFHDMLEDAKYHQRKDDEDIEKENKE